MKSSTQMAEQLLIIAKNHMILHASQKSLKTHERTLINKHQREWSHLCIRLLVLKKKRKKKHVIKQWYHHKVSKFAHAVRSHWKDTFFNVISNSPYLCIYNLSYIRLLTHKHPTTHTNFWLRQAKQALTVSDTILVMIPPTRQALTFVEAT